MSGEFQQIDVEAGLMFCGGDPDFYQEILLDFTELPIKRELEEYAGADDYKNYNIRIHGFKNNAYSVGAKQIGDLAYKMEQLTSNNISVEIEELQKELFEQYDAICRQIVEGKVLIPKK